MVDCTSNLYTVSFTDTDKTDISVAKGEVVTNKADIAFVGKTKKDYGEIFNENVLHLLENFACPEEPGKPGIPNLASAFGALLENPVEGQIWYNTTVERPYRFDGVNWVGLGNGCDVAGNYGVLANGQQIPNPVCEQTGYVFPYEECTWTVAPSIYPDSIEYMRCFTDENANITMEYRTTGQPTASGTVNYQIIGIRGNINNGDLGPEPSPPPGLSQTPTPNVTPSPTGTPGASPSPTPTATVTPTQSATVTPTPSITPSETPPAGLTPTATPTPSPTPSITPSQTASRTPTPTPSITPSVTPDPTPPITPTPTPSITPSDDKTGNIIPSSFTCEATNNPASLFISNESGTIKVKTGFCTIDYNDEIIVNGLPSGEDGTGYSFTATNVGLNNATGPTSGVLGPNGTNQIWTLSVPGTSGGNLAATVRVDITGPPGVDGGSIFLFLVTYNTIPIGPGPGPAPEVPELPE
jgi:hypothetical protein